MKLTKSQTVMAIIPALALAAMLLALPGPEYQVLEADPAASSGAHLAPRSTDEQRSPFSPPPARRSPAATGSAGGLQPTAALLQSLGAALTASAESSLQGEVDIRFGEFLAGLSGSAEHIANIRAQLVAAYADIMAFGIAVERGDISPAEAELRRDPNYVVNQMSELLSSEELTELELFMEEGARQRFKTTYSPQLELIGVELDAQIKERLLEALFTETYLRVNSDGLGAPANLEAGLQRQLDAIESARESLRRALSTEQFQQADLFLIEQEQGLLGAQTIFSTRQ